VYSRTWDWYTGRGRTPEKLGDVSDVKREDLLPVHFFQITGIVQDHCTMSENLGVDFDHISVGERRNFFDLVSCPGFGA
jgi:hypothetical protein